MGTWGTCGESNWHPLLICSSLSTAKCFFNLLPNDIPGWLRFLPPLQLLTQKNQDFLHSIMDFSAKKMLGWTTKNRKTCEMCTTDAWNQATPPPPIMFLPFPSDEPYVVDGWHQLISSLSHCLRGFIHPRWCRISSINSMIQKRIKKSILDQRLQGVTFSFPDRWRSLILQPLKVSLMRPNKVTTWRTWQAPANL